MSEKLTRKEKIARQQKPGVSFPKQNQKNNNSRRNLKRVLGLIVAVVAFLLYANTLNHGYVLDDFGLIKDNTQTKKGIAAVPEIFKSTYRFGMNTTDYSLYRPLTKAMFAVEWNIAPNTPALGHIINVLLFALLCYVLFSVLNKYMKDALLIPFITTLIFAAHPLHTEVVANIKGRDEIVSFLLCLTALLCFHNYIKSNAIASLAGGIIFYFIALFAKESAVTFVAVVPLMFYFFTKAPQKKYLLTFAGMAVVTIIFLIIRKKVLGNIQSLIPVEDNFIAGIKDLFLQKVNAIYIIGVYLKMLVFPAPLIADGSYNHFPLIGAGDWKFIVPALILIACAVYAILNFRKKNIYSFCIIYFFITASIVTNIVILIGTNYGERLMFVPSLGFCLAVAVTLSKIFQKQSTVMDTVSVKSFLTFNVKPILVAVIIVLVCSLQTTARNAEWKSDYTLYSHDVKKVPDSAHMLFYYANHITSDEFLAALPDDSARNKTKREGIDYLTRAVNIYPKYADGYQRRGFIYYQMGDMKSAEDDYKKALEFNPTHPVVYNNYGTLCFNQNRFEDALQYFQLAIKYNPSYAHALNNAASVYGVFGQGEKEMVAKDPANGAMHEERSRQNFETAISYFKKSIDVDPAFAEPYRLMAVTYKNLGNPTEGERYEKLLQQVVAKNNVKN